MQQLHESAKGEPRLDRVAWHRPLISIIVTHFNYSTHVRDSLLSILDQTYLHWECVVVDDASDEEEFVRLDAIIKDIGERRIRIVRLKKNRGQIRAFFSGLPYTTGEFICPLDPDDRYAKTFLEEALDAHMNQSVICPLVCTDQFFLKADQIIGKVNSWHRLARCEWHDGVAEIAEERGELFYIPREKKGWQWTSTSSLMLRRPALKLLQPKRQTVTKNSLDSYVMAGCHALGGTLFLARPLIYRQLHKNNAWISAEIYSSAQSQRRPGAVDFSVQLREEALQTLRDNGVDLPSPKRKGLIAKWSRSLSKRLARARKLFVPSRPPREIPLPRRIEKKIRRRPVTGEGDQDPFLDQVRTHLDSQKMVYDRLQQHAVGHAESKAKDI